MSIRVVERVGALRQTGAELWAGGRGPILVAVAAGWLLSLGVRMVYPAVLPGLRAAYGLDLTTAGALVTVLWGAYAVGQLPGGLLDDRFGGGRIVAVSTGVSAVAVALVVAAGSVGVLFAATVLFGLATALYGVARFTILSAIYPDHSGTAIGLTMAAGDLGSAALPPLAGVLAVAVGWQFGLGVAIPLFVVAAAGIARFVPGDVRGSDAEEREAQPGTNSETDGETKDALATGRMVAATVRSRPVLLVFTVQTLSYCVWQSFTAFYPTYLIEAKGVEPTVATVLFGGFFAMGMVVKPLAGSAYDAYGLRRSLPALLVVISASMFLVSQVEGLGALVVVTALASSVLGYGTITLSYLTEAFPTDVRATGLGTLRTAYMLIGAGSPTVVGALADGGYFDEAFLLLGGVAAVTVPLSLFVPER